jgi:hypothetical protein
VAALLRLAVHGAPPVTHAHAATTRSLACAAGSGGAGLLAGLRGELYRCLGARRDALFEACDALACRPERVHMLAELSLEPECRQGHGGLYDALNCGEVVIGPAPSCLWLRPALRSASRPASDDPRRKPRGNLLVALYRQHHGAGRFILTKWASP